MRSLQAKGFCLFLSGFLFWGLFSGPVWGAVAPNVRQTNAAGGSGFPQAGKCPESRRSVSVDSCGDNSFIMSEHQNSGTIRINRHGRKGGGEGLDGCPGR